MTTGPEPQNRDADQEERDRDGDPEPCRGPSRERAERHDQRGERRWVVEKAEPTGLREGHVIELLAVEEPDGGLVICEEVVPERVARERQSRTEARNERQDRDDRERRARESRDSLAVHHALSVALRRLPRCMSGMRNRSQATRSASPGRARMRDPRLSNQRIGTIASR